MINGEHTSISFIDGEPISKLANLLKLLVSDKYGYEYSDIVILSLKAESSSILDGVNNLSGIPILNERSNSAVFFTTSRKFKGLESRVVIVTDIDESCFRDEAKKRNFYVACSRATQKLCLFINADEPRIKSMANLINTRSRFAAKGKIAMKTQANILEL